MRHAHPVFHLKQCWKQWLERHPDFPEAHYRLGLYAFKKGNNQAAVDYLREAFALDPTLPDIQAHLGKSLMKLGKPQDALVVLEKEIAGSRGESTRQFLLGHAYLETGQHDKARRAFRTATEITPTFTGAYYGLATAYTRLGQLEEAKKSLEEFQKRKSQDYVTERAKVQQDEVARMRRLAAIWYTVAGRVYAREGDAEQAETLWLRAAAADPAQTESRQALVDLYRRQGRTAQASRLAAELAGAVSRERN